MVKGLVTIEKIKRLILNEHGQHLSSININIVGREEFNLKLIDKKRLL